MTVCIAAVCENGAKVVAATDGMLSHTVSADVDAPKMIFLGDWLLMFSGALGEADLILDHLRGKELTADNVKSLVRSAYRKRLAEWTADRHIFPFDMDMSEFKTQGQTIFGTDQFAALSREMQSDAANYNNHALVIGWGEHSPRGVMLFGFDNYGMYSHAYNGIAAIGSGAEVAMSTLLMLEQARHHTLEETLYAVLSAKFAAERCEGVGKITTVRVAWKRTDNDPSGKPSGNFVQEPQIEEIRKLWERYGKPRFLRRAEPALIEIAASICGPKREIDGRTMELILRNKMKASKPPSVSQTPEPGL